MKIGVAGTGNVARDNYLPWLAKLPGVDLVLFSLDEASAAAAAARHGGRVVKSLAELAAVDADVVFVLTNEQAHYDVALKLVQAGAKRLFIEKPLVAMKGQAHVEESDFLLARELLQAADAAGCQTAMSFNYRFFKQTQRAAAIVQQRGFGKLASVSGVVHYACWSHCIDLVLHFGGPVGTITGVGGAVPRSAMGIDAHDIAASFTLEQGGCGTLIGTCALAWQHALFELVLVFERGRIHMRGLDGPLEVLDASGSVEETFTLTRDASQWQHYGASFVAALTAYFEALGKGMPPPVPARAGLLELQFEAALRRSVREGRRVDVAAEFPVS